MMFWKTQFQGRNTYYQHAICLQTSHKIMRNTGVRTTMANAS